jgi:endonuclease YncB( thermonuclease family)
VRKLLAILAAVLTLFILPTILSPLMGGGGLAAIVSVVAGIAGAFFVGRAIWQGRELPTIVRNNKARVGWGLLVGLVLILMISNLVSGQNQPQADKGSDAVSKVRDKAAKEQKAETTHESKPHHEKPVSQPAPAKPVAAPPASPSSTTAKVVSVVDGDTFDIDHAIHGMDRVRLIGVDTPEVYGGTEPCGPEASDFTTRRLEGQSVRLEIGEDDTDPYGRLLAYVFIGNELYNKTLVKKGLADAVSYPPNTKYDAEFEAAEITAQTPSCATAASASASASASAPSTSSPAPTASPNPSPNSKLNNGVDDVNCEDLPGPVQVDAADEDNLDADGDGTGCD